MTATPGQPRNARFAAAESTRLPMRMRQTGYKYLQAVGGRERRGAILLVVGRGQELLV